MRALPTHCLDGLSGPTETPSARIFGFVRCVSTSTAWQRPSRQTNSRPNSVHACSTSGASCPCLSRKQTSSSSPSVASSRDRVPILHIATRCIVMTAGWSTTTFPKYHLRWVCARTLFLVIRCNLVFFCVFETFKQSPSTTQVEQPFLSYARVVLVRAVHGESQSSCPIDMCNDVRTPRKEVKTSVAPPVMLRHSRLMLSRLSVCNSL